MITRRRLFEIVQVAKPGDKPSTVFDMCLLALIILNSALTVVETFDLSDSVQRVCDVIGAVSVLLFTVEYICRIVTADFLYPGLTPVKARFKYVFSLMGLIDLFAILPFYLPMFFGVDLRMLRMLRLFRLLRIFKLGNYFDGLRAVGKAIKDSRTELVSSLAVIGVLMLVAAVAMYDLESEAQPEAFANAFDALWWAICTLTTVGYGDIYPITEAGRFLSAIIALLGVGLVAVPSGIISSSFMKQMDERKAAHAKQIQEQAAAVRAEAAGRPLPDEPNPQPERRFCPYCGEKLD